MPSLVRLAGRDHLIYALIATAMLAHGFDMSSDAGAFKNEVCRFTGSLPGGAALCGQSGPTRGSGPLLYALFATDDVGAWLRRVL